MNADRTRFFDNQVKYFRNADARKYWWMTANPYFSSKEKELLQLLNRLRPTSILEIGCGEGGNLANLEYQAGMAIGIDLFEDRCRFAQQHCPSAAYVRADGYRLPIRSNALDVVFCRDLLHHVLDKEDFILEMARACRPNGHVVCIEACGRNPVMFCLATAIRAERGLLASNPERLKSLLEKAGLADVQVEMHQPLPSYRILLHPSYGFPSLGERQWYRRWSDRADRLLAKLVPKRWWAYTVVSGRKPA